MLRSVIIDFGDFIVCRNIVCFEHSILFQVDFTTENNKIFQDIKSSKISVKISKKNNCFEKIIPTILSLKMMH